MIPDPYRGSAHPGDPQSWNRYTYALGDPVNHNDPSGLGICSIEDDGGGGGGDDCLPGGGGGGLGFGPTEPPCDPSQADCDDPPCVGADGFSQNPSPFCQTGGGPPPVPTTPQPVPCDVANGITSNQQVAVETIMGENSWYLLGQKSYLPGNTFGNPTGPAITQGSVLTEDVDMFSVLVNRTQAVGYPSSIGAVASQPGQFGGYSAGPNGGITKYNAAVSSTLGSSLCNDLMNVVAAMDLVLATGSKLPSNYLFWKAINQGSTGFHKYKPGDIYVANTAFGTSN